LWIDSKCKAGAGVISQHSIIIIDRQGKNKNIYQAQKLHSKEVENDVKNGNTSKLAF